MSVVMDSQDVRGYLRGLCLIAVVRATDTPLGRADIDSVLRKRFAVEIEAIINALAAFTGLEEPYLAGAVDELFEVDDEFLKPDNLNLQLGLLSARPIPVFPFIGEHGVHRVALLRPFLDTATNLVHAAVRVRMQSVRSGPPEPFWGAFVRAIRRLGGGTDLAAAIGVCTIANVVSDIVIFNTDAPDRTDDPVLAARTKRVLEELSATDLETVLRGTGQER